MKRQRKFIKSERIQSLDELAKTPTELWAYCAGTYKPKDS